MGSANLYIGLTSSKRPRRPGPAMEDLPRSPDTRRLYHLIADKLRVLIQRGDHPEGSRLPPERDLAQQLGVSRPSLREALIALEIEGTVEIRMGSGVYVCTQASRRPGAAIAMGESPAVLMQARAALEGAVVVLACAHATPRALTRIHESVEGMRADIDAGRDILAHDREFHVRIAEMSGNSVLVTLVGMLFDERQGALATHMRKRLEGRPTAHAALAEHERIYRCLRAGDPLAAEASMRSHIGAAADRWVTP